jgi:hypothetical protein
MLTRNEPYVNADVNRMIQDIILENSRYKRELRTFHREVLVCPVLIKFFDDQPDQHCVSRNISPAGISLISAIPFVEHVTAKMEIYRLKSAASCRDIVAECRWCKPFGPEYWMSGWQFVKVSFESRDVPKQCPASAE